MNFIETLKEKLKSNKKELNFSNLYEFPKTMNENWEIINEDLLAHLYEKHNNDIIDYFKGTDKLLVYKLEESSEFKINKICSSNAFFFSL